MFMKTPYVEIDIYKIENNSREIVNQCKNSGIEVVGVSKGVLGHTEIVKAMLRGGISWIGDSRLLNIEKMKTNGIKAPFMLMRSPHLSEVKRVIENVDCSLNSEIQILRALSKEAIECCKIHSVIIMVDMGDLREGIMPEDLFDFIGEAISLEGIKILGLGMNLTDLNGTIPTFENNNEFLNLAKRIEEAYQIKFEILSAGNSSSQILLEEGGVPNGINQFRIGEGILLGKETISRKDWPNTYQDAFKLVAEVIECKRKPSVPIGKLGQDAFGNSPIIDDKGIMLRGILNIGRQDIDPGGLIPVDNSISVIGATSDHTIIDLTCLDNSVQVGDFLVFQMSYSAMLTAMTSPYVGKYINSNK